jgi:hypothetical protein
MPLCRCTAAAVPLPLCRSHTLSPPAQARTTWGRAGALAALSLVQQRLRLGWGTLRAGLGMAVGAKLYGVLQEAALGGDAVAAYDPLPAAATPPSPPPPPRPQQQGQQRTAGATDPP